MNLASRMRPVSLSEYAGQRHLVGEGKLIARMVANNAISSMIFWGPPGTGKTTLAHIIAHETHTDFYELSAVMSGKEKLLEIVSHARENQGKEKKTILFIDEIHRWNKAQQDVLLPHVESGLITLIGATTENPSFEIISALLSRCRVFVLKGLDEEDLGEIIDRALTNQEKGMGSFDKTISPNAKELLIRLSGADARIMLNALEMSVVQYPDREITQDIIKEIFQTRSSGLYDKKADEHYNIISAFIKSMRGSDPDATLYYLARMLESGEDPKFIARRMIIFASEDIGLSDRGALIQANAGFEAVHKIGMPEAGLILAHIAIYLASAKKSRAIPNSLYQAKKAVYEYPNEPIPLHLRSAPTKLMKQLGYAKGYSWKEGEVGAEEGLSYLPEKLKGRKFWD